MFSQRLIIATALLIVTCHAGLVPGTAFLTPGAATVHTVPSAVSHQSFTRIHNSPHQLQQTILAPTYVSAPFSTSIESHLPAAHISAVQHSVPAYASDLFVAEVSPPVVQPSVHTPAHLTYAAAPIVYKMLPNIKPVRAISYDSLKPSPSSNGYYH